MLHSSNYVTQAELVSPIINVLKEFGGGASKQKVVNELYSRLTGILGQPYYQTCVTGDVPRWLKFIEWAKEKAKHEGLVKRPAASGRGYRALTEKGKR